MQVKIVDAHIAIAPEPKRHMALAISSPQIESTFTMMLINNICIIHAVIVQNLHIGPKEGKVYLHFKFLIACFLTCFFPE